MSVEENNRAIAKFMGVKHYPWGYRHENKPEKTYRSDDELKYDSSWSCLMPVVDKIEDNYDTEYVHLVPQFEDDTKYQFRIFVSNTNVNGDNKRECFYKAVVEFIKWYNEK